MTTRLAWFSPLPPARSGIAAYSADLVPRLGPSHAIDCFSEATARDFVWKARRDPYDLVVYQLGNAPCHDYMWGYLAAFPGLVVLHDARLHHARARDLLHQERFDDYRREFWYDHPEAHRDFVEYAVAGLGGPIYYCWPMLRVNLSARSRLGQSSIFSIKRLGVNTCPWPATQCLDRITFKGECRPRACVHAKSLDGKDA